MDYHICTEYVMLDNGTTHMAFQETVHYLSSVHLVVVMTLTGLLYIVVSVVTTARVEPCAY
jgi:hypothetical protein